MTVTAVAEDGSVLKMFIIAVAQVALPEERATGTPTATQSEVEAHDT